MRGPSPLDDPCEYADSKSGQTNAEMLEANISHLERRIRELEGPPVMEMRGPYASTSTLNLGMGSGPRSSSSSSQRPIDLNQEPPVDIRRSTLSWFFSSYTSAFGLFLNISQLLEDACAPFPLGHPSRPHPGLMYTIYFLIAYLHSGSDLAQDGSDYLAQVVLQVGLMLLSSSSSTTSGHPKTLIHAVQAQILLAKYFFLEHRTLEGKYHLGMAVSLVSSAGLYSYTSTSTYTSVDTEKVNAFWMVYSMHSVWDPPGGAVEEQKINVPWLMDDSQTQIRMPRNWADQPTVTRFLSGVTQASPSGSLMELYSKACILLSRATSLANAAASIDSQGSEVQVRTVILIRTLTHASTIQLPSTNKDTRTSIKSLTVARGATNTLQTPSPQVLVVNSIFGVLRGIIGSVLVNEIWRLRQSGSEAGSNQIAEAERTLDVLVTTVGELARHRLFFGETICISP
ncbi:hypothetical protein V5O48_007798 [Marasmius crinis-equi]|uniref:Transcription factor domain-containing protein n=1 Tax=Marasmius crinis-equi TaxID=585013 RepID=A0ABR3FFM9_9AGAR